MSQNNNPEKVVREIKRKTRRLFTAEEKIRIVLEGLRGEDTIAELCRREGISPNLYYNCLLYTSPSPRDRTRSRMPSSA